jgi:hypothetical protein
MRDSPHIDVQFVADFVVRPDVRHHRVTSAKFSIAKNDDARAATKWGRKSRDPSSVFNHVKSTYFAVKDRRRDRSGDRKLLLGLGRRPLDGFYHRTALIRTRLRYAHEPTCAGVPSNFHRYFLLNGWLRVRRGGADDPGWHYQPGHPSDVDPDGESSLAKLAGIKPLAVPRRDPRPEHQALARWRNHGCHFDTLSG